MTTVVDKVNRIESIFAHGNCSICIINRFFAMSLKGDPLLMAHAHCLIPGDRLLIGTGTGQLLVYDIKEPLGNMSKVIQSGASV